MINNTPSNSVLCNICVLLLEPKSESYQAEWYNKIYCQLLDNEYVFHFHFTNWISFDPTDLSPEMSDRTDGQSQTLKERMLL